MEFDLKNFWFLLPYIFLAIFMATPVLVSNYWAWTKTNTDKIQFFRPRSSKLVIFIYTSFVEIPSLSNFDQTLFTLKKLKSWGNM